ncbi:MAG: RES domain-containing protein [Acetobacteraceae bacterium]
MPISTAWRRWGGDVRRYASFDYAASQAIAAAAYFLGFDGLIVPSARGPALTLVIFTEKPGPGAVLEVAAPEPVDGSAWRSGRHRSPPRAPKTS